MTTFARLTSASALMLCVGWLTTAAELTTLAGTKAVGTLALVDPQFVAFREEGRPEPTKFPVKELAAIDLKNKVVAPAAGAKFEEVELTDGSVLRGTDLRVKGKKVELTLLPGPSGVGPPTLTLELGHLSWVMRGAEDAAARAEWKKLVAGRGKRDLFVVRQSSGLNPLAGTVIEGNESGERVTFEREDGNRASLPLARASGGLVFNQPQKDVIPPTVCKVNDVFGNVWYAAAVEVAGSGLRVRTVCGAAVEYPSAQAVASLDFSQGNVEYLSRLAAEIAYPPPETDGPLGAKFPYAPQVALDKALGGDLVLGGRKYANGVSVPPDTTLTYKVEGFREFKAVVGLPDGVRPEDAALTLRVEIDGRPVLNETVSKKDRPREVTLNVKDAKELRIAVERVALFAGSQLSLADARVQK